MQALGGIIVGLLLLCVLLVGGLFLALYVVIGLSALAGIVTGLFGGGARRRSAGGP